MNKTFANTYRFFFLLFLCFFSINAFCESAASPTQHENDQTPIATIFPPILQFVDFTVTGPISRSKIYQLMSTNIYYQPKIITVNEKKIPINNCKEYWKYDKYVNNAKNPAFHVTCTPLLALSKVKKPNLSYLTKDSLTNPAMLSPTILPSLTADQAAALQKLAAQGLTVADVIKSGDAKMEVKSSHVIALYYGHGKQEAQEYLYEIARGDFTGNGIDSILVSIVIHSMVGTYHTFATALIMRSNDKELLQIRLLHRGEHNRVYLSKHTGLTSALLDDRTATQ